MTNHSYDERDDARANARDTYDAWSNEVARLSSADVNPENATTGDELNGIAQALSDAVRALDRLHSLADEMAVIVERMRDAIGTSKNAEEFPSVTSQA